MYSNGPLASLVDSFALKTHAELFGYSPGRGVADLMDAYNPLQPSVIQPKSQRIFGSLCSQPKAPKVPGQPPANFDRRKHFWKEIGDCEPYKTDKAVSLFQFDRKQAKALLLPRLFKPFHRIGALLKGLRFAVTDPTHDLSICTHRCVGLDVARSPTPKQQSFRLDALVWHQEYLIYDLTFVASWRKTVVRPAHDDFRSPIPISPYRRAIKGD